MLTRPIAVLLFAAATLLNSAAAFAASAPAAAQAPQPIPAAAGPVAPVPAAPSETESVGDWVVRCFPVKGPAPCDMLQVSVAKDNEQQRILSVSFAYVPDRDGYGMQIIVPLGVTVQKHLAIGEGTGPLSALHFTRCEPDGCYVEALVDNTTMDGFGTMGEQALVAVTPYGKDAPVKMALSLKGFSDALAKMKTLARQKAVAAPAPAAEK